MSSIDPSMQSVIKSMRSNLGWGDAKIADALGLTVSAVRYFRETMLDADDPVNLDEIFETRNSEGFKHVVIISDTQWPFQDDASERAMQQYIQHTQPDELVHIGDAADFYSLTRFLKSIPPSQRMYLLEELEVVRAKFKEYNDIAPNARKRLVKGNHDERLDRYLEANGEEMFDLINDALSYEHITGAVDAGWEVFGPYGTGFWIGEPGGLYATHGDFARKSSGMSAKAHVMEKYGHSVVHGHTHRLGQFFHTRQSADGPETIVGIEVGTIASMTKTPRATNMVDWQYGFAEVWVSETTPRFHANLLPIIDGGFIAGGVRYGK